MTGSISESAGGLLESLPPLVVLVFLTAPLWLRVVNELSVRTVGAAVVICPYCGAPGIVQSKHPKVIR
jgi:hypothetical protein